MTEKEKSTLWQQLGVIEGIGFSLDEKYQSVFFGSLVCVQELLEKEMEKK